VVTREQKFGVIALALFVAVAAALSGIA